METRNNQGQYKYRLIGELYQRRVPATVIQVKTRYGRQLELTPRMILDLPDLDDCLSPTEIAHVRRVHEWDKRKYKHAEVINQTQPTQGWGRLQLVKN